MKKLFTYLAIAASVFAICACNKEPGTEEPQEPEKPDVPEYEAPITIDGDFSDWAKIDASKVVTITCADGATKTDLKGAKVFCDEKYIFIYVEFDFENYDNNPDDAHFNIYLNSDNDTSTGGYIGDWDQGTTPCLDISCQGDVIAGGEVCDYDPTQYAWSGEANTDGWEWEDVTATDFVFGKGTKKAFEISLKLENFPLGSIANEFTMGLQITVNGWDSTGTLPNSDTGAAPLQVIKLK